MLRFTIRDLLWLMVVVALAVALWANQRRSGQQIQSMTDDAIQLKRESQAWENRARALRSDLMTGTNKNTNVEFIPDGLQYTPKKSN